MGEKKDGIPCMNCQKIVSADTGKLFAEVFVCADCFVMAESLQSKLTRELNSLLLILKDRIREHLVQGKFHFNKPSSLDQLSKQDVLSALKTLRVGTNDR